MTADQTEANTRSLWELFKEELERQGESTNDIEAICIGQASLYAASSDEELREVYSRELEEIRGAQNYGGFEFPGFRAWTTQRVYFIDEYDGWEVVDSISRHPPGENAVHVPTTENIHD